VHYAVVACSVAESDPDRAIDLGNASLGLSIAGMIITLIVAGIVAILVLSLDPHAHYAAYCNYYGCHVADVD